MKQSGVKIQKEGALITADKSRVLIRQLVPGGRDRIKRILKRIAGVSEEDAHRILEETFTEFGERHHDLRGFFRRRFAEMKTYLPSGWKPSETVQLLIGAYFSCEYSLEAAALFNPSIVPHPDQSGVGQDDLRFIMSLRATGEGHISSIEFRTGTISRKGKVALDRTNRLVSAPNVAADPSYDKTEFVTKLEDEGTSLRGTGEIVRPLPETFKRSQLRASIDRYEKKRKKFSEAEIRSVENLENMAELNYELEFPRSIPLSERAIFPVSSFESNGIEDARFVRFADNGSTTYYATYTAYNGKAIMPLLL
ncbi:MAG TPA: glycosidase, partial [Bacteroidota bacterium]